MSLNVLTDDNFTNEVIQSKTPVLVDFYATWCGPCKQLAPIVEKLAGEYKGKLKVGKLNIDDSPNVPSQFAIRAVPTLLFFRNGKPVDTVVGFKSESELRSRIDKVIA